MRLLGHETQQGPVAGARARERRKRGAEQGTFLEEEDWDRPGEAGFDWEEGGWANIRDPCDKGRGLACLGCAQSPRLLTGQHAGLSGEAQ